ncbi:RNA polymerase sigma factor, partial [Sphingopyxis panaciterrulae]
MVNRRQRHEYSAQDRAILDRLDRKFRRSLLTYFGRRTSDVSDLEDMVQDVFVRLIKRGSASELERQNLSAYVFETASSVLTDHLRKKITHRNHLYEPFDQDRHGEKDFSPEHVLICQTAFKRDPRSASKRDPLFGYDVGLLKMALRCARRRAGVARPEARAA